jgi:hypothetical protein
VRWRLLPAALLAAGLATGGAVPDAGALPLDLEAAPVEIGADGLTGLRPLGAWELTAAQSEFGGLSGLVADPGRLVALSDGGSLVEIDLGPDGLPGPRPGARLLWLTERGERPERSGLDAEALTRDADGGLVAGFERDHRLAPLDPTGSIGRAIRLAEFERLPFNAGIEALATLQSRQAIAIVETPDEQGFPFFVLDPDGTLSAEGHLPAPSEHLVTGADVGPDGRLYVVYRYFSLFTGVSIRLRRFDLAGMPPLPVPDSAVTLGEWGHLSGIDNMEAVALDRGPDGGLRLWLVSDDNFNPLQRTLLMLFAVEE